MQNPHDQQQHALVRRICNSVERLAEVVEEINGELDKAEESHAQINEAHAVWGMYEAKMKATVPSGGGAR